MSSSLRPSDWSRLTAEAFKGDLSELGWKGKFKYDDPEVVQLRSQLDAHAGIQDLECVDPATPGFAQRAAFLLNRDGVSAAKASTRVLAATSPSAQTTVGRTLTCGATVAHCGCHTNMRSTW